MNKSTNINDLTVFKHEFKSPVNKPQNVSKILNSLFAILSFDLRLYIFSDIFPQTMFLIFCYIIFETINAFFRYTSHLNICPLRHFRC